MQAPVASPTYPSFVSHQVTEANRYFLHLKPNRALPIVVVCGGCERMRTDYLVQRRTFSYFCVEFIADGAGWVELNGKNYALRPGVAFAYGPGVTHVIRGDPQHLMRKYYINFVGREAARILRTTPLGIWKPAQISAPDEVLDIFVSLQRDAFAEEKVRDNLCAAHLRVLLLKIGQKAAPYATAQPRVFGTYQRARHYIEKHYVTLQSAEEVAAACHMTPVHLSRIFRRFGRSTPYHFLMRLKMNRAAALLVDSGLLVKEVAEELNFGSAFQFSRAFKRSYGLSPEHFIRTQRGDRRP